MESSGFTSTPNNAYHFALLPKSAKGGLWERRQLDNHSVKSRSFRMGLR